MTLELITVGIAVIVIVILCAILFVGALMDKEIREYYDCRVCGAPNNSDNCWRCGDE